jgi:N-hydroxyarylamine O-acetyltransferase
VHAGGRAWLADVGFGSGLLEPLSFDVRAPQAQGGWAYELAATGPAAWELREREAGRWAPAYSFEDQRVHPADVVMANHFSSTFPTSPFVTRTVAVRKDERAVRRLLDRTYGVTRPDGSVEERELGDAEIASTLREVFALPLDDDQVRRLIAGLPAARSAHP